MRVADAAACLAALTLGAGCGSDLGFAVALTAQVDVSVDDAALASITRLVIASSGDETGSYTLELGRSVAREERIVYRPGLATRALTIEVQGETADGTVVAAGATATLALTPGHTTDATVLLTRGGGGDLGMDDLAGVDLSGADLAGADLSSTDLAGADLSPPVAATISFVAASTTRSLGLPQAIAVADFNGDGHDDIAVACSDVGVVQVFLANADGTPGTSPSSTITIAGVAAIAAVNLLDTAGGTPMDLVVTSTGSGDVYELINDGTGSFTIGSMIYVDSSLSSLAAADFSGSGFAEFVVGASPINSVYVFDSRLAATQTPAVLYLAGSTSKLLTADLTGGGKPSLIALQGPSASAGLAVAAYDSTSGNPLDAIGSPSPVAGAVDVAFTDLNGDGKLDAIAITSTGGAISAPYVGGNTNVFGSASAFALDLDNAKHVAVRDLDGDGHDELFTTHEPSDHGYHAVRVARGMGSGAFAAPRYYGFNQFPTSLGFGDFDHDGKIDLAVGSLGPNTVDTALGLAGARLAAASMIVPPTPYAARGRAVLVDQNGDGTLDLVLIDTNRIAVYPNDGTGTFGAPTAIPIAGATALAIGPLRTGKLDLVAIDGGYVSVALAAGTAYGAPTATATGSSLTDVALVDLDGDHHTDVVAIDTNSLYVYYGDGSGLLSAATFVTYALPSAGSQRVAIGDVTGDKVLDVVELGLSSHFDVFPGLPTGRLDTSVVHGALTNPADLVLTDVDGDHVLDVIVAGDGIQVYLNNGLGTFTNGAQIADGTVHYFGLALADVDGDHVPDLLALSSFGVHVFHDVGGVFVQVGRYASGLSGYLTTGDVDGDRRPDVVVTGPADTALLRNSSH